MRRAFRCFLLLAVNLIIQSTLLGTIEINQIRPNTMLIIIVSYAILRGDVEGAIFGFFAGLLQDIFFGRYIGLHAMLGMLTGYFCGKPFKDFYFENYLLPMFLVSVSTFSYEVIFYVVNYFFRGRLEYVFYFGKIILPVTVYNLVLSVPIYAIVYIYNNKLETYEKNHGSMF